MRETHDELKGCCPDHDAKWDSISDIEVEISPQKSVRSEDVDYKADMQKSIEVIDNQLRSRINTIKHEL